MVDIQKALTGEFEGYGFPTIEADKWTDHLKATMPVFASTSADEIESALPGAVLATKTTPNGKVTPSQLLERHGVLEKVNEEFTDQAARLDLMDDFNNRFTNLVMGKNSLTNDGEVSADYKASDAPSLLARKVSESDGVKFQEVHLLTVRLAVANLLSPQNPDFQVTNPEFLAKFTENMENTEALDAMIDSVQLKAVRLGSVTGKHEEVPGSVSIQQALRGAGA